LGNVPNLESYLTMGSLEIFKSLQVELGYDIEFRRSGSLQAIQTEAECAYIQRRMLELRSKGYTVDLLSTQEAQMIEPALSPALLG
jgi:sarcosine oxidase, subunit beta